MKRKIKNRWERRAIVKVNKPGLAFVISLYVFVLVLSFSVYAEDTWRYSNYQYGTFAGANSGGFSNSQSSQYYSPSFDSYYSSLGVNYREFWPILGDSSKCEAGQDFIVSVRPGGCMPMVVRSDLLEEQNVPIFCKLDAVKLNPLIDVNTIKSVSFKGGQTSKQIAGVSFHPSKAALRGGRRTNLDSPLLNDVGYVVVILKRIEAEKDMPEWVEANLTAVLRYDIEKAFGTGKPQIVLPVLEDDKWQEEYKSYGFWKGRGYARLDYAGNDGAEISIYTGQNNIMKKLNLQQGETSNLIYMPGFYCRAGVRVKLNSLDMPTRRARIQVDDEEMWVRQGESFLDGKCRVYRLDSLEEGGEVDISCGSKMIKLNLGVSDVMEFEKDGRNVSSKVGEEIPEENGKYIVYSGLAPSKIVSGTREDRRFIVVVNLNAGSENDKKYLEYEIIKKTYLERVKSSLSGMILLSSQTKLDYEKEIKNKLRYIFDKREDEINIVWMNSQSKDFGYKLSGTGGAFDKIYGGEDGAKAEEYFARAVETARDVKSFYGGENDEYNEPYGQKALREAAALAAQLGKRKTEKELYKELITDYPESNYAKDAMLGLENLEQYDYNKAAGFVNIDYTSTYFRLMEIKDPSLDEASVSLDVLGVGEKRVKREEYVIQEGEAIGTFNYKIVQDTNKIRDELGMKVIELDGQTYVLDNGVLKVRDASEKYSSVESDITDANWKKSLKAELIKLKGQDVFLISNLSVAGKRYELQKIENYAPASKLIKATFKDISIGAYQLDYSNSEELFWWNNTGWISVESKISEGDWKSQLKAELQYYKQKDRESGSSITYNTQREGVKLIDFTEDEARVEYTGRDERGYWTTRTETLAIGQTKSFGMFDIKVKNINLKREATISILPEIPNGITEANFSVRIGIEKRAIQLSPEKTSEMIAKLNKTIEKWESITKKLGEVVKVWKGACFATSTLLTVKSFFENLGGKSMARQQVMRGKGGWQEKCEEEVAESGGQLTKDACFLKHKNEINTGVNEIETAYEKTNQEVGEASKGKTQSDGLFGTTTDTKAAGEGYMNNVFIPYYQKNKEQTITLSDGRTMKMSDAFGSEQEIQEMYKSGRLTWAEMRDTVTYGRLQSSRDATVQSLAGNKLGLTLPRMADEREYMKEKKSASTVFGDMQVDYLMPERLRQQATDIRRLSGTQAMQLNGDTGLTTPLKEGDNFVLKRVPRYTQKGVEVVDLGTKDSGKYKDIAGQTLIIKVNKRGETYEPTSAYVYNETSKKIEKEVKIDTVSNYMGREAGIVAFEKAVPELCRNTYKNPEVRYFEAPPYKGMPAAVPVDVKNGWYAGTKPIISGAFGMKPYTESGQINSFWLCNVGKNGLEEFDSSAGDDSPCIQINLGTGQSLDQISCLSEREAKNLISKAQSLVREAAQQYGKGKTVSLSGIGNVKVGNPQGASEGTSCQDFMSPEDCYLLFNVCDPVVCPASRCNLGGSYQVDDVVQTGIVGSLLLCLPNAREGIFVPVCLTGIHAGLDAYVSILKSFRGCLQENLNTGKHIGICDEIFSIYICEFFWRQLAPLMDVLIPKIIAIAYGQGTRGGGEYNTVQNAWDNMQKSSDYFTEYYAANSFKAFKARSTGDAGTEVCKAFVGTKFPTDKNMLDKLLEPESPVQFYAWFDEVPYSEATVPATAQYKVYYHIYAGNDIGHYYSVYLKNPPQSGYYSSQSQIVIDTGYAGIGQSIDQTKDFTAPQGYKELCVRIDANEKCGFKQVSTDFALNYIKEKYAQEQASMEVNSEKECVSGAPSLIPLAQPNIQEGISQAAQPAIYQRGIIRVCASDNPGARTNPDRWKRVGVCDEAKGIACWIDQESVGDAIQNNKYIKNQTLEAIGEISDKLEEIGAWTQEQSNEALDRASGDIDIIAGKYELDSVDEMARKLDEIERNSFGNELKVEAVYMKFELYRDAALHYAGNKLSEESPAEEIKNEDLEDLSKELKETSYPELQKDERQKILVAGKEHELIVTGVEADKAYIEIASTRERTATLAIGEEKKFSIETEGYYDLSVQLTNIYESKTASFIVKGINEKIDGETSIEEGGKCVVEKPVLEDWEDNKFRVSIAGSQECENRQIQTNLMREERVNWNPLSLLTFLDNSIKIQSDAFEKKDGKIKIEYAIDADSLGLEEGQGYYVSVECSECEIKESESERVEYKKSVSGSGDTTSSASSPVPIGNFFFTCENSEKSSFSSDSVYPVRYLKYKTYFEKYSTSSYKPEEFDPASFKALLAAVASRETSMGSNGEEKFTGYIQGPFGVENQVSMTAGLLKRQLDNPIGVYDDCKNTQGKEKMICVLSHYGANAGEEKNYGYAEQVIGFYLQWQGTPEFCVSGNIPAPVTTITEPEKNCQDKCPTNNGRRCSGNSVEICSDSNNDKCLEWSKEKNCLTSQTCEEGTCKDKQCEIGSVEIIPSGTNYNVNATGTNCDEKKLDINVVGEFGAASKGLFEATFENGEAFKSISITESENYMIEVYFEEQLKKSFEVVRKCILDIGQNEVMRANKVGDTTKILSLYVSGNTVCKDKDIAFRLKKKYPTYFGLSSEFRVLQGSNLNLKFALDEQQKISSKGTWPFGATASGAYKIEFICNECNIQSKESEPIDL